MTISTILKLRKQWFKFKTKEFIQRNVAGLLVLVLFLPGVAVGDNFKTLMTALSQPFLLVVAVGVSFDKKLIWLSVLLVVFIVWSRAQKEAITGGSFRHYLQSLPMNSKQNNLDDLKILLLSNHFLWVVISASAYFLFKMPQAPLLSYFYYGFLLLLLFTAQYIAVFKAQKKTFILFGFIVLLFILPLAESLLWFRLIVLTIALWIFIVKLFVIDDRKFNIRHEPSHRLIPKVVAHNLYFQMLFKAGLSSTLFRLTITVGLVFSLLILVEHFIVVSNNELLPYAYVLEAFLAYYLSGFYVVFSDERKGMINLFNSLPVKKLFWAKRDVFAVTLLALFLHTIYFIGASQHFSNASLSGLLIFHILLLFVCFPLRTLVKKNQTFITFVVLFIITAITLFNFL